MACHAVTYIVNGVNIVKDVEFFMLMSFHFLRNIGSQNFGIYFPFLSFRERFSSFLSVGHFWSRGHVHMNSYPSVILSSSSTYIFAHRASDEHLFWKRRQTKFKIVACLCLYCLTQLYGLHLTANVSWGEHTLIPS